MQIHVVRDIDDPALKADWERLAREADVFPQSAYHWCSTWWRYLARRRELHTVMVLDDKGHVMGIAPLCIERRPGVRVLRSFPVNYGDFFQLLVSPEAQEKSVFEAVLEYVTRYRQWNCALFSPVNDRSILYRFLNGRGYTSKHLIGNIVADIGADSWDEYAATLSGHRRRLTQRKMRALEERHDVDVEVVRDGAGYANYFDRIRELIDARGERDRPKRSDVYMECVRETNLRLFEEGRMMLYLIKASGTVIAYRIGIVHGDTFYDWNTSYDMTWAEYSPGSLSIAYMIRDLIARGFAKLDFMAGAYDFKLTYSATHEMRNSHLFVMGDRSLGSRLFCRYQLAWRDRLRPYYRKIVHPTSKQPAPLG